MTETRIVPANWSVAALHVAGAVSVAEVREDGVLTGYEVSPPVSDQAYAAAAGAILVEALLAHAAQKRKNVETGGIMLGGQAIKTDAESLIKIAGAKSLADEEPEELVDFKAANGWVQIDAAAVRAIALAVGQHYRACFRIERQLCDAIEAGTVTTKEEIDAAAWPENVE